MRFQCYLSCLVVLLLGFFSSWTEAQEWIGTITATHMDDPGVSPKELTFGADPAATDGFDLGVDDALPGAPPGTVDLYPAFIITGMFPELETDIKEKADVNEWELSVRSDTGRVELTWDLSGVPSSKAVSLTSGDTTVNMRSETSLELAQGSHTLALKTETSADVEVTKTVDNPTPDEDDIIVYTVTATNTAAIDATGIEVTDQLPTGVTYVSDDGGGSYNSSTGVWTVGDLNNASATLQITATVNSGTAGSTITNTATRTAMTPEDPNPANDSDSAPITVKGADLEVSKEVDNSAPSVGDTIIYTVTVTNNGPDDATNAVVTDRLPDGVTYASDDGGGSYVSGTGAWTVGTLANGASTALQITATVDSDIDTFTITNEASVTGTEADSVTSNNSDTIDINVKNADLAVTKTVDNSSPNDGDTIVYTVTITNNGPDDATNIEVTDQLPTGVTYASDDSGGSYNSSTGAWTVASLANGASVTLKITATVTWPADVFTITNTASVTAVDQPDPDDTSDSGSVDVNKFRSDLAVSKTVDNAAPNEGGTIIYTVTVTNNGPDAATNVAITDLLPTGVTYVSDDSGGSYNSSTGVWTVGTLAVDASATLKITATVDAGTGGTSISNTASVTGADQPDPTPGNNSDSADITVQLADLAVTKAVDKPTPNEGDAIVYTVTVTNSGPDAATNVAITELLPTGVTYASDDGGGSYVSGTGVWTVGSLAVDASATLKITATVDAGTGGTTISNGASVTAADQADPDTTNNSASIDITVQLADLGVAKVVDNSSPNEGDAIVYTITVTNNGPDAASSVAITDLLPTGVTYASDDSGGSYVSGTGVWTLGTLAKDASATLKITATVGSGTGGSTIVNTASAAADQADPVSTNDSASASITVQSADLAVSKTVDEPFPNEGDTILYTVTVTNSGPDAATNLAIADLLPTGVTYASDDGGGSYVSGTGVWTVGTLANGASATLKITATVDVGSGIFTIINTASVTAVDQADPDNTNNSSEATIVIAADLAVSKTADDSSPNEGDTVVYTVTATNNGPGTATNVAITDLLPTGVTYVSDDSGGSYVSGTGVWTVGTLANSASVTLKITATVGSGTGGTTIVNTASVTAVDQADPTPGNNSASASIIVQLADVGVSKTVDKPTPEESDTIIYTVTVINSGPDAATNIVITDILPTGVTYTSDDSGGSYNSSTGVWTVGSLANGASAILKIATTVDTGTGGTTISNGASVTAADQADSDTTNNSASADITVLVITRTVDDPTPNEGDSLTCTISVANSGPASAVGIVITQVLPEGLTYVSSSAGGAYNSDTRTVTWTLDTVPAGTTDLTITATVDAGTGGTTITIPDVGDVTPQSIDLAVTKTVDSSTPNEADTISYTVTVTNNGPDAAANVVITDQWPTGVTYASDTPSQGGYVSGTGVWTVGGLANGASATLIITATVDADTGGTTIVNAAGVTSVDQADSDSADNSASASITVQLVDLAVAKTTDDASPYVGGTITYTVTATNNGPDAATNVVITDPLPTGVTYASDTPSQGSYVSSTGVWTVGDLANGASATLIITATVDTGTGDTTISNEASVTSVDQADSDTTNNSASADITVVKLVDVSVNKTVDNPAPNEGNTIAYTVTVTNSGPDAATNLAIADLLPTGVTYVSSTPSQGSYMSSTGVWTVGDLAKDASATLKITTTVDAGTAGTTISNAASVKAVDQADSDTSNDSDSADIEVQLADVAVSKTVNNAAPSECDAITYTLTVTNNGPDPATGIEVTDLLPAGVTYVSSTPSQGTYDSSTGLWTVGNLANGASGTLAITVTVDLGMGESNISNTASVTAMDQTDPDGSNNTSSVTISVLLRLQLVVSTTPPVLSPAYDILNNRLILKFNREIDIRPTRIDFDGIGMEVNNSGNWDFALSNARGLRVEADPTDPSGSTIIIDMNRDHVNTINLAVALIGNRKKVDLLLRRGAFTDVDGGESRKLAGTENVRVQSTPPAGDVSGNGEVTAYDAALILRVSVGEPQTIFPVHDAASEVSARLASYGYKCDVMMGIADMSNNGELSAYDAALALRRAVGLPDLAPAFGGSTRTCMLSVDSCDRGMGDSPHRLGVSINLDDVSGIYSADIVMAYDPQVLTMADVSRTPSTSEWLSESSYQQAEELNPECRILNAEPGEIIISLAGAYQPTADGSLVNVSFDVNKHTGLSLGDAISKLDIIKFELNGGVVKATIENLPKAFALMQNYPNPFNPETWIPYQLSEPTDAAITIYNVKGQMVRRLELGYKMPGHYTDRSRAAHWDGRNEIGEEVASGVYFYQLQTGRNLSIRKMIVLR